MYDSSVHATHVVYQTVYCSESMVKPRFCLSTYDESDTPSKLLGQTLIEKTLYTKKLLVQRTENNSDKSVVFFGWHCARSHTPHVGDVSPPFSRLGI